MSARPASVTVAARAGSQRIASWTSSGAVHGRSASSGGTGSRSRSCWRPSASRTKPDRPPEMQRAQAGQRRAGWRAGRGRHRPAAHDPVVSRDPQDGQPPALDRRRAGPCPREGAGRRGRLRARGRTKARAGTGGAARSGSAGSSGRRCGAGGTGGAGSAVAGPRPSSPRRRRAVVVAPHPAGSPSAGSASPAIASSSSSGIPRSAATACASAVSEASSPRARMRSISRRTAFVGGCESGQLRLGWLPASSPREHGDDPRRGARLRMAAGQRLRVDGGHARDGDAGRLDRRWAPHEGQVAASACSRTAEHQGQRGAAVSVMAGMLADRALPEGPARRPAQRAERRVARAHTGAGASRPGPPRGGPRDLERAARGGPGRRRRPRRGLTPTRSWRAACC